MSERSMVERVARALARKDDTHRGWRDLDASSRIIYRGLASAAFEGMNNPGDEFLRALSERMHDARFSESGEDYPVARNFIRAFVDAALNEQVAE